MVERVPDKNEVPGSIPGSPTEIGLFYCGGAVVTIVVGGTKGTVGTFVCEKVIVNGVVSFNTDSFASSFVTNVLLRKLMAVAEGGLSAF